MPLLITDRDSMRAGTKRPFISPCHAAFSHRRIQDICLPGHLFPEKHHGGHLSLDAFLRRCKRLRHCGENLPAISSLLEDADNQLFTSVLTNTEHILHHYMPVRASQYQHHLRPRIHNKEVIHTPNP